MVEYMSLSRRDFFTGSRGRNNIPKQQIGSTITLSRKINVKCYPIVAEAVFKQQRSDLVTLLQATQEMVEGERLPPRLLNYLQKEKLWDAGSREITAIGQQLIESGRLEEQEKGLYYVWYSVDDPLFGYRPLLLQRYAAFDQPQENVWKKGQDAKQSEFFIKWDCPLAIAELSGDSEPVHPIAPHILTKFVPHVVCEPVLEPAQVELMWQLTPQTSSLRLKGALKVRDMNPGRGTSHHKRHNIAQYRQQTFDLSLSEKENSFDKVMEEMAGQLKGYWDQQDCRLSVGLSVVKDKQPDWQSVISNCLFKQLRLSKVNSDRGEFDSVELQQVGIKPNDHNDATNWQSAWLQHYHADRYRKPKEARQAQTAWLETPALQDFDLPLVEGAELLQLWEKKEAQDAWWRVAAINDLTPPSGKRLKLPLSLVDGENLSVPRLIETLCDSDEITHLLLSDRYVCTPNQIENLKTIEQCFKQSRVTLHTLKPRAEQNERYPSHWDVQYFKKKPDNHGRFWIFFGVQYVHCWECSSGLDFINQEAAGTTVNGTPGFTPKEIDELPLFLRDKIEQQSKAMEAVL